MSLPTTPRHTPSRPADRRLALRVERWFEAEGRDLPWRRHRSGYAALVSETMLQQTQVRRVVPIFEAFMARFPTVVALAEGTEQEVLALWQGLGYYARAKRLHAAARSIVALHGGMVPADVASLRALPGVGRYTAGAIASVVFEAREPIVDTNVSRVLMRIGGVEGVASDPESLAWTWRRAGTLVTAAGSPAKFNEGLMELGALVCTAAAPRCDSCPLAKDCAALAAGAVESIPASPRRAERVRVVHHVVVLHRRGRLLLEQRPARGPWASMWQLPTVESPAPLPSQALPDRLGLPIDAVAPRSRFVHRTTHREVVFIVHVGRLRGRGDPDPRRWVALAELSAYPLSNPMRRIVREST